jgi:hypothetical protein
MSSDLPNAVWQPLDVDRHGMSRYPPPDVTSDTFVGADTTIVGIDVAAPTRRLLPDPLNDADRHLGYS